MRVPLVNLRRRFTPVPKTTVQDNTALDYMNDATILENLRARHGEDEIYTYTASVLLAVNPYKDIPGLYGEEQCARYCGKHIGALPPHPYAIADRAYRALTREQRNQGLLISGESGAGKTETAKIVMQYLAFASGSASGHAELIQARVLRAQPILESFGNAVTMRNSNSSRFGKYNRVFFDGAGALVDASITTYLLESSRVVIHADGERTYHCFYEMLQGLSDERLEEFGLERGRTYRLLTSSGGESVDGSEKRDRVNFERLCHALATIGLDQGAVNGMLAVLAGLVHLGEIEDTEATPREDLEDVENECVPVREDSVEKAAKMLGMDPDELRARLTKRKVAVPGRKSIHEVPRSTRGFRHTLQSFIKTIYKRLFDRTVERINESFRSTEVGGLVNDDARRHIGVLDIYGFENMQNNSFEQLCINLANERLQQCFVENALSAEQELYKREGLPWSGLPLPDAQPVCNAIGQVFRVLDEYSQNLMSGVGNPTDKNFCQKVVEEAAKDAERKEVLRTLRPGGAGRKSLQGPGMNEGFVVKHYAGQVEYSTSGWLEKNNDKLLAECEALICDSSVRLVRSLGEADSLNSRGPLFRSISKKYTKDLEALLVTLGTCNLHYIRCFKPNGQQQPSRFDGKLVLDQIVQCGTVELVKIMHDGFPNRCRFDEIVGRFRDLLPERFHRFGTRTFIEALMSAYEVPEGEWALGMSRLFLKAGQLQALESMHAGGAAPCAQKLAEILARIIRKRWARVGHAVRLCCYLPRLLEQIRVRRAAEALARTTAVVSRLAPRLLEARARVEARRAKARRRFRGFCRVVRLLNVEWLAIRRRRAMRVAAALHAASLVHVRARRWLARAQLHLAEEAKRQDDELRRQEQLRAEEESRRQEEARRAEELKHKEEKRVQEEKLQEEARRRQEEEERRQHAEAAARQQQEELERERQRREELEKQLEEERSEAMRQNETRRYKEETQRRQEEEQLQQEWCVLAEERRKLEQDREAMKEECVRHRVSAAESVCQASTVSGEEDDSSGSSTLEQERRHKEAALTEKMEEKMLLLQAEVEKKMEAMKAEMLAMRQRNAGLEQRYIEERQRADENASQVETHCGRRESICSGGAISWQDSPSARRPSLIPLDEEDTAFLGGLALQTTPPTARREKGDHSGLRSGRLSLLSIDGSAKRGSATRGEDDGWWAERRKALYAAVSPLPVELGAASAGVRREPRATAPASVAAAMAGDPGVRDLAGAFDDFEADGAALASPDALAPRPSGSAVPAGAASAHGRVAVGAPCTSRLKQPTKFQWSKRHSIGAAHAGGA